MCFFLAWGLLALLYCQIARQEHAGFEPSPVYTPHKGPEMVSSAPLCGSVSTASPLSTIVSPSSHLAPPSGVTPPLHCRHRTAMLSLRRARRIRSFFGPALRVRPFFCPSPSPFLCTRAPHLPLSLPRSLPPSARHASRAVLTFDIFFHAFHVLPRSPSPAPAGC